MKRGICLVVLGCVALLTAAPALAQEGMPPMGAPEEMKLITKMDGQYDVAFKFRMDPTAEYQESQANCTISTILDGSCQQMEFSGAMMGMPFQGIGWTTYSRGLGKWQTTWVDNMGASISYYLGEMMDGKMVFEGEETAPDGSKWHSRNTTFNITDDSFDWKMEMSTDGEEYFTTAMATYTRVGGMESKSADSEEGGW